MAGLVPSKSAIKAFVEAAFKHADPGTYASLRAFDGDLPFGSWRAVKLNGKGFGPLIDAAAELAGECADAEPERPVFCPPIASFRRRRGASEADLANGLLLTVECDDDAQEARERLEKTIGPCTVVVASGGRWKDPFTGELSDKLHLHWRLTVPTRTPEDHSRLKEARQLAARIVRADVTAITAVHPLRWPGSWHRKEAPRLARIVELNEDAEIGLGEALDLLRAAAASTGIELSGERNKPNKDLVGDIRNVVEALERIPNNDLDWHEWNKRGLAIWAATAGSEEGFEVFDEWSQKSDKYDYAVTRARWDHYSKSPPGKIGAGSLIREAQLIDPTWRKPSDADVFDDPETPQSGDRTKLRSGSSIKMGKIEWVWSGYLARGKLHVFGGQKGVGKSTLAYGFAAIITSRGKWPDGTRAPQGDVFVWSGEDDIADTILPRFAAAGGDCNRIYFADRIRDKSGSRRFDPSTDMPILRKALAELPRLRLIIIDPIVMASRADSHKNAETRIGLQPVVDLANACGAAVLGITHFTKNTQGRDPIERITGSLAFGALPRVVFGAAKGREDEPRKFVRIASNIGKSGDGFEYTLRQAPVPGHDFDAQIVEWGNSLIGEPRELLDPQGVGQRGRAMKFLKQALIEVGDDGISVKELKESAEANGFSWPTVERAKADLPLIQSRKVGAAWRWFWNEGFGDGPL